jgi:hypothetical protein
MATKKKAATTLRSAAMAAVGTEGLLELIEKLGVVDLVLGRLKSRLEETDLDELFDELKDYLKRNPEVLVISLGTLTIATGLLVWMNARREWDGAERRGTGVRTTTSTGRVRKAS